MKIKFILFYPWVCCLAIIIANNLDFNYMGILLIPLSFVWGIYASGIQRKYNLANNIKPCNKIHKSIKELSECEDCRRYF